MACNCGSNSQTATNDGLEDLDSALDAFWPARLPSPPTMPWLVGMVTRRQVRNVMRRNANKARSTMAMCAGDAQVAGMAMFGWYMDNPDEAGGPEGCIFSRGTSRGSPSLDDQCNCCAPDPSGGLGPRGIGTLVYDPNSGASWMDCTCFYPPPESCPDGYITGSPGNKHPGSSGGSMPA